MIEDEVVRRLDALIALTRLAYRDELARAHQQVRADLTNAAILDGTSRWIGGAKLQAVVVKKTKVSTRTVQLRIADLISEGLLEKRGGGRSIEYRSTGLV